WRRSRRRPRRDDASQPASQPASQRPAATLVHEPHTYVNHHTHQQEPSAMQPHSFITLPVISLLLAAGLHAPASAQSRYALSTLKPPFLGMVEANHFIDSQNRVF